MANAGYFRFPTVHDRSVIFVCEDDLWSVPLAGGTARRLTAGVGECSRPQLSPDGRQVAFTGKDEGNPEVYVMASEGGPSTRLTYQGARSCQVVGWRGEAIVFASHHRQAFQKLHTLYTVPASGGHPTCLGLGSAMAASWGRGGVMAIGRNTLDIARWKRYRGGTAGNIWIDARGDGDFAPFLPLAAGQPIRGNLASPMVLGDRLYFVSDHEGVGNLYSATFDGRGLRRHTDHDDYYVRNPSSDGKTVVYHAGGDLFRLDVATGRVEPIDVVLHSARSQRNRKFVDAARYLEDYAIHPEGHSVAVVTRGQSFTLPNWERAVTPMGESAESFGAVRYRLTEWLANGTELVTVADSTGEEALEVFGDSGATFRDRLDHLDIGRVTVLIVSPRARVVALANHRQQVVCVDLDARTMRVLDQSLHFPIQGLSFSPDGRWLAYGFNNTGVTSIIKVADLTTGATHEVTRTVLKDVAPCFDPEGRYLYFISYRVFNPVYDNLDFDMNFPKGMKPYAISLRKDLPNPFEPVPLPELAVAIAHHHEPDVTGKASKRPSRVEIDFDGIADRIVPLPVPEGKYDQILAVEGRLFFTSLPVLPSLGSEASPPAPATLHCYEFDTRETTVVTREISHFKLSLGGETLAWRADKRLRVVNVEDLDDGELPEKFNKSSAPSRKSGWIDLSRIKVLVQPGSEWRQMYREAWRLQRDNFWVEDMSGVDWRRVYDRYLPLVDRASSRSEFSDIMWEMQGELGTSHCYEMGGDYRPEPAYAQGSLGADFSWDAQAQVWRVAHLVKGDSWAEDMDASLRGLGAGVMEGDQILAIHGKRLRADLTPEMALVNLGGQNVKVQVADARGGNERVVVVKALTSDLPVRYREWVEGNRRRVHEATAGRVGYVHIPNMMGQGMSEFFRGYLAEVAREALIVDVRFNGGGHTSQLILEKLARRRLGYDISRWGQPQPYPSNAVLGPIVAITNEFAGSDGDIFSHSFKLMKLGTLVGKRTWGGVIGIWPRHALTDGTVTTQPEFSFWFEDAGWGVENYGTDPHIDVDVRPQDYQRGADPQLDRAVVEVLAQMAAEPPKVPRFPRHPDLSLPKLPPRPQE